MTETYVKGMMKGSRSLHKGGFTFVIVNLKVEDIHNRRVGQARRTKAECKKGLQPFLTLGSSRPHYIPAKGENQEVGSRGREGKHKRAKPVSDNIAYIW